MWKWLLGLVVVVGGGGMLVATFRPKVDPAALYRQKPVVRGSIASVVNSTGTVHAVDTGEVMARVSGPIETLNADFNSRVKKGDVLATIDPTVPQAIADRDEAEYDYRQADHERIEALLSKAKDEEKRVLELHQKRAGTVSQSEIVAATADRKQFEAQLKVAKAHIAAAKAALRTSRKNLADAALVAPNDGIVIERKVRKGNMVAVSLQPPIAFLIALDLDKEVDVLASVDEADIGRVREAERQGKKVSFTVDAYPDTLFEGGFHQVRYNATTVQNVVTYTAVIKAPNPDLKLMPGMTATVTFEIDTHDEVLKVPNAALRFFPRVEQVHAKYRSLLEGDSHNQPVGDSDAPRRSANEIAKSGRERHKRHIWVLDGELLAAVEVTTGLADSEYTEIVSGELKEGQDVVVGLKPRDLPPP